MFNTEVVISTLLIHFCEDPVLIGGILIAKKVQMIQFSKIFSPEHCNGKMLRHFKLAGNLPHCRCFSSSKHVHIGDVLVSEWPPHLTD